MLNRSTASFFPLIPLSIALLFHVSSPAEAETALGPVSPIIELGALDSDSPIRVGSDGEGRAVVVWEEDRQLNARLIDSTGRATSDAVTFGAGEIDFGLGIAGQNGRFAIAWSDFGRCGVSVLDQDGQLLTEGAFMEDVCSSSDNAVAWIGDQKLAVVSSWFDFNARSSKVSLRIFDAGTGEFELVREREVGGPADLSRQGDLIVVSTRVDFEVLNLQGEPIGEPFPFSSRPVQGGGGRSAYGILSGDQIIAAGIECDEKRCAPLVRRFDLDGNLLDEQVGVFAETSLAGNPALEARLYEFRQGPTGDLLASWNVFPAFREGLAYPLHMLMDGDGNAIVDFNPLLALVDNTLQFQHGADLSSVRGVPVNSEVSFLAWREGVDLAGRQFGVIEEGDPGFSVSLNSFGCDEDFGWVEFNPFGAFEAFEVRRNTPDGELVGVGDRVTDVEGLVQVGETFYFIDIMSEELLGFVTVAQDDLGCGRNALTVTAVEGTEENGRFVADVAWDENGLGIDRVEIRLRTPEGKLFASGNPIGSAATGPWVRDGLVFFLIDANPEARIRVKDIAIARP
jgi:hypothetical protein